LEVVHACGLPCRAVPGQFRVAAVSLPSVDVRGARWRATDLRSCCASASATAPRAQRSGRDHRDRGLLRARWSRVLGPRPMAASTKAPPLTRRVARWLDRRLGAADFARSALNKVFPDHWSFMLGELALYCFIILILTGVYLTFFFHPSPTPVVYQGSYAP